MFFNYRLTRNISSEFLLLSITRIHNSTCLDTSNKYIISSLRISVPLNYASSKWHKKITPVKTKERDVTPRNSRHWLLADVTVNFSLPHVVPCHYVITIKHRAKFLSGAYYGSSVVLFATPVVHIRTAAISTSCRSAHLASTVLCQTLCLLSRWDIFA